MKRLGKFVIILLLLGVFVYSAYQVWVYFEPVMKSKVQQSGIKKEVIFEEEGLDDSEKLNKYLKRKVDFERLKGINEDVVAWICIPDTSIDYPVVIGDDDTEYMYKDVNGNRSVLGSIFSLANTSRDLSEDRVILFGHNMREYVMFGELKRFYRDGNFRNMHTKMYLYTEEKTMELSIFSIFSCLETNSILYNSEGNEFETLLSKNTYSDVGKEDLSEYIGNKVVSLVTCKGVAGTSNRLVVNGVVVKEVLNVN